MNAFEQDLGRRLERLRDEGLWRELRHVDSPQGTRIRIGGREFINFSSNDYLGLANHPALIEAATKAVHDFGAGAGASRLICGSLTPYHEFEEALATFKGTAAALTFSTGYAAALGTITALMEKDDIIIVDRLVHACCVDAAKLSGAKLRVFAHNDFDDLNKILLWANRQQSVERRRILIVTESVFSMDGDLAPLRELVELKDRHGAWLMLDEAHATGVFGKRRCGLAEALGLSGRIEIQMGTLGKAVGASGGYIAGSRALIDLLINRARSFMFSTSPVPAAVAAAKAGIDLIAGEEGVALCRKLWSLIASLKDELRHAGWPGLHVQSPIAPLIVGEEGEALRFAADLREHDVFVPAIRYPTVARGGARLRLTLSASHAQDDLAQLTALLADLRSSLPAPRTL